MGSGTTRKSNDSVIINRPKGVASGSGGGGGYTETGGGDMNNVCPPTFGVKLNSEKRLVGGSNLLIEKTGILFAGQKVGSLTKLQFATIARCSTEGFIYRGKVVNKKNGQYGVFTRQ